MNARRIATSLVLATAAFASMATSMAIPWSITESAPIPTTEVTTAGQVFSITTEVHGPVAEYSGGELQLDLELSGQPANLENAAITVTVISEADPSVREEQTRVVNASVRETMTFSIPLWETCEADPCFDDYRLEVRNATANTSILLIASEVRATLFGNDTGPDDTHSVAIQVLPLGNLE
jgi:hypothetical protein